MHNEHATREPAPSALSDLSASRSSRARVRARARLGFTLIELLVVIGIIAVLVGLLLPALRGARNAARQLKCTSNQRQLAIAWTTYTNDYRNFPVGPSPKWSQERRWGWGGVYWPGVDAAGNPLTTPMYFLSPSRPLNPYVLADSLATARAEAFKCPQDASLYYEKTKRPVAWQQYSQGNASGEGDQTAFGQLGTSYEANSTMCGGYASNPLDEPVRTNLGFQSIRIEPSRYVLLGDTAMMTAGTMTQDNRVSRNLALAWWHGYERWNLAFLDGSARHMKTEQGSVSPRYSFERDVRPYNTPEFTVQTIQGP